MHQCDETEFYPLNKPRSAIANQFRLRHQLHKVNRRPNATASRAIDRSAVFIVPMISRFAGTPAFARLRRDRPNSSLGKSGSVTLISLATPSRLSVLTAMERS